MQVEHVIRLTPRVETACVFNFLQSTYVPLQAIGFKYITPGARTLRWGHVPALRRAAQAGRREGKDWRILLVRVIVLYTLDPRFLR